MHSPPRFAIVKAPSPLGLRPEGVQELAGALLDSGLSDRLHARNAGTVKPPSYDGHRDGKEFLNYRAIMEYSVQLSYQVNDVLDRAEFPIVLGGDCSILLGNLLALTRRGRFGLLFIDGHTDFYQAEANINGEIASSELAIATGREPQVLGHIGKKTLVRDEDVVAFGFRDETEQREYGSQPLPPTMTALNLETIRRIGIDAAVTKALQPLVANTEGYWLHLDVDALNDKIMPAVDYRMADGLSWDELKTTIQAAMATGRCVGMDIAIFNPRKDKDGQIADALVNALVDALTH